jgi:hypothetical protein
MQFDPTLRMGKVKTLMDVVEKLKHRIVSKTPSLPEGFEKMAPEAQAKIMDLVNAGTELKPISVKKLVTQKKIINMFMNDKDLFDRNDTDVLDMLKGVQGATDRDLQAYGKSKNMDFLEKLNDANTTFAKRARRENLDHLLSDKLKLGSDDEVAYQSLATLLKKHKNKNTIPS